MTYVCGFLFDSHGSWVWLIKKSKPKWQVGMLNGIGGKIEENELPLHAMRREFLEETGAIVDDWQQFMMLSGPDYGVYFFRNFWNGKESFNSILRQTTDEAPMLVNASLLPTNVIPNLRWIIPMAQDRTITGYSIVATSA